MLLAADLGERVSFLTPAPGDGIEPGMPVIGCGEEPPGDRGKPQIDIGQFASLTMKVGEVVTVEDGVVTLDVGEKKAIEVSGFSLCIEIGAGDRMVVVLPSGSEKGQQRAVVLTVGYSIAVPERDIGVGARIR
jgi:hypothetical protein